MGCKIVKFLRDKPAERSPKGMKMPGTVEPKIEKKVRKIKKK